MFRYLTLSEFRETSYLGWEVRCCAIHQFCSSEKGWNWFLTRPNIHLPNIVMSLGN